MGAQILLHLQQLLLLLLACTQYVSNAYTYEPPGRDPISIDKIRSSEIASEITTDNFDELMRKGKLVFIKFYAPSCPHCKSFAGDWNKLATYYQELPDNDNVVIGSIDCTNSPKGKELCAKFKIMGLPTLLYGDASLGGIYLEEYGGEKTFDELKSFAAEALVPKCNPGNLDACSPNVREELEEYMAMSYEALDNLIKGKENHEEDLKTSFKNLKAEMQKNYDQSLMEKELQITKVNANVKLIKEVIAMKE
mmetsp:Transcript_30247/g.54770  ORF Transcript_30247/g.54770 Transcript_30247/m.54770 type:complete len:251 (+) Transcript_30247:85-837(+)